MGKLSKLEERYSRGYRGGYRDGYEEAIKDFFSQLNPPKKWENKNRQLLAHIHNLDKWWKAEIVSVTGYDFPPEFEFLEEKKSSLEEPYGCVYFINMVNTNFLKVGYTFNFKTRFNQIQNNVPADLIVLGKDWTKEPKKLESAYHKLLKPFRLKNGEWFDVPELTETISKWRNHLKEDYQVDEDFEEKTV